jgi:hypothetical protein
VWCGVCCVEKRVSKSSFAKNFKQKVQTFVEKLSSNSIKLSSTQVKPKVQRV